MPYKLLQDVAGRTLIVDIAIQREGARPVALQVGSTAMLVALCLLWHSAVLSVALFQHAWPVKAALPLRAPVIEHGSSFGLLQSSAGLR